MNNRCAICRYAKLSKFHGYTGLWVCLHPYRSELDNTGRWSYPKIDNPERVICRVPHDAESFNAAKKYLRKSKTPRWCYVEAETRVRIKEPNFDPAKQRKLLDWAEVPDAENWEVSE